jgi:RNA polymerase sigma-70 factor (ECF subfamily)
MRKKGNTMEASTRMALVLAVKAGDQTAFETLVEPYRSALLVHCYQMLGSLSDAEDLVQETLLQAWKKRETLSSPDSYRAWLYRIATNLCLNRLRSVPRRSLPQGTSPPGDPESPLSPRQQEPVWLEPFPDTLLADQRSDPEDRALQRERLSLAFLMALHYLTPMQRAILLLREVLEWPSSEVADWLNLSVPAVNSALQRARRALHELHKEGREGDTSLAESHQLQVLLNRYMALWEQEDIPGLVALLREDAWFTMPPVPTWFQGRVAIAAAFRTWIFRPGRQIRLLPTRANRNPAFGFYWREPGADLYRLVGLHVLDMVGEQISGLTVFTDSSLLPPFALPPTLSPASDTSVRAQKKMR